MSAATASNPDKNALLFSLSLVKVIKDKATTGKDAKDREYALKFAQEALAAIDEELLAATARDAATTAAASS